MLLTESSTLALCLTEIWAGYKQVGSYLSSSRSFFCVPGPLSPKEISLIGELFPVTGSTGSIGVFYWATESEIDRTSPLLRVSTYICLSWRCPHTHLRMGVTLILELPKWPRFRGSVIELRGRRSEAAILLVKAGSRTVCFVIYPSADSPISS